MRALKESANGILLCLIEVVIGILLLINPIGFTSGIIIAFGIGLLIFGLICVVKYFRMGAREAAISQLLLKGLVCILAGGFCTFKSYWFAATFPLLTIVYGIATLLAGLGKVQWTVDMIRIKKGRWYLGAVSAALSILCAAVILARPFSSTAVLWMFTGISLIVEAVIDIIAFLIGKRG
ncbi:MAG: DUF308 domain-containing protein [Lachnospiraceae bacterium]|nr:DUF308 domain-containing protein [Lachnospiraceae bacterium]